MPTQTAWACHPADVLLSTTVRTLRFAIAATITLSLPWAVPFATLVVVDFVVEQPLQVPSARCFASVRTVPMNATSDVWEAASEILPTEIDAQLPHSVSVASEWNPIESDRPEDPEGTGMNNEPTVYVVDDDDELRHSLEWTIRSVGLRVASFSGPREFLQVFDPGSAGCLVFDLRLPDMSGLELHRAVRARGSRQPFIIITGHGDVPAAVTAMRQGAVDFIEKPFSRQQLLERIHQAIERDAAARRDASDHADVRIRLATLTPRERDVVRLVVAGMLTKEVGRHLNISPKTVEVHRSNVIRKMGVESVAQLVRKIVPLGPDWDEDWNEPQNGSPPV